MKKGFVMLGALMLVASTANAQISNLFNSLTNAAKAINQTSGDAPKIDAGSIIGTFLGGTNQVVDLQGTWSQDTNTVILKFGKAFTFLTLEGIVKSTANGYEVLFDADKFIAFAEKAAGVVSQIAGNSAIGTIAGTLSNVKGVKAGFKLNK